MFSCVTMQSNVVIRDSYRGGGGSLDNTRFQDSLVESKFISKNLTSKIMILQDMPPT